MGEVTSSLQTALEIVESLSLDEQSMLLDIVYHRLIEQRRSDLVKEVAEAREAYRRGDVRRGTVQDLMAELSK
jgi:hypothetical protein